ncbi:hypothetical protein CDD83_7945 [Cordyceps sp. RAO-2017]|nr:hypothetical protein CDD83_7945 [Cordyceps sp. RAO-2017]
MSGPRSGTGTSGVIPRACQNCRLRKIRCNRETPCSNCLTSNIACQSIGEPGAKRMVAASKASDNSSSEIAALHRRLASLEQKLEKALAQDAASQTPSDEKPRGSQRIEPTRHVPRANRSIPVQGDSSFDRQAYLASQIPELVSPEAAASPSVADELEALRDAIRKPMPPDGPVSERQGQARLQLELVPSEFVLRLLRELRGSPSLLFLSQPVQDPSQLESLCQRIYFPINPLSIGELTVFHGMLYFAMQDMESSMQSAIKPGEVDRYRSICWANFQAGMDSHELAAIPTYENTLALTLAALDSQLKGNKILQWNLISAAAKHCLALGYHRDDTSCQLSSPEQEARKRLFWHIFMSDSSLSLSMGRAPIIQGFDVDAPPLTVSEDPRRKPWDAAFVTFVRFAVIQASIYRKLYSPRSRRAGAAERQRIVAALAANLGQWYADWQQIDCSDAHHGHIFQAIFSGADVTYYSVLTLLHRGATPSNAPADISAECFKAAKQGLEAHLESYPRAMIMGPCAVSMYAVWILLFTSLTPYIVTFLHCIASSDSADLALLGKVLESIEEMVSTAEGCKRQYELCKALHRIAEAFIESLSTQADRDAPQLDRALNLSLLNPLVDDCEWNYFQSSLEEWNGQPLNPDSFTLGSRLDSHTN